MYLLAQVGLLIATLISPIPEPETTITMTLQMEEIGAAMVGIETQIVDRSDEAIIYGSCTSNEVGICVIEINDTTIPAVVRGRLDMGSSGSRAFIFEREKDISLIIPFTEFGQVIGGVNHEPHPTLGPDGQPTVAPARPQETATAIPTTELVVVDPETFQTSTPRPTVDEIVDVIETGVPVELTVPAVQAVEPEESRRVWVIPVILIMAFGLIWGGGVATLWKRRGKDGSRE